MTDSTRGIAFGKERRKRGGAPDFARNLAIAIAIAIVIDDYANDIPKLQTAVNDASQLAELLRDQLDYKVWLLTEDVTRDRLLCLLHEEV